MKQENSNIVSGARPRGKGKTRAFLVACLLGLAAFCVATDMVSCASLRSRYSEEVHAEIAKDCPRAPEAAEACRPRAITEQDLAGLPEPVRKHFRVCGFMGKPLYRNVRVTWREIELRRGRDKGWMRLRAMQFNSVREPARIVLMRGKLFGFLPFEGRDKYQAGRGNLRIVAAKGFTVSNERSPKLDASELVTVLAETFLVPSYALQPYIHWRGIDSLSAEATMEFGGASVRGVFHFAPAGECIRFDTGSRWQSRNDASPIPWSAYSSDYRDWNGLRLPGYFRAVWHEKDGDFEYVKGGIAGYDYDVDQP